LIERIDAIQKNNYNLKADSGIGQIRQMFAEKDI